MTDLQKHLFSELKQLEVGLEQSKSNCGIEACITCAYYHRVDAYWILLKRAGLMRAYQKWKKGETDD